MTNKELVVKMTDTQLNQAKECIRAWVENHGGTSPIADVSKSSNAKELFIVPNANTRIAIRNGFFNKEAKTVYKIFAEGKSDYFDQHQGDELFEYVDNLVNPKFNWDMYLKNNLGGQ